MKKRARMVEATKKVGRLGLKAVKSGVAATLDLAGDAYGAKVARDMQREAIRSTLPSDMSRELQDIIIEERLRGQVGGPYAYRAAESLSNHPAISNPLGTSDSFSKWAERKYAEEREAVFELRYQKAKGMTAYEEAQRQDLIDKTWKASEDKQGEVGRQPKKANQQIKKRK